MGDETFDYPTMARALILGDRDTVARKTREGLDLSLDPKVLIFKGLIPGMDVVGEKFRRNEYYVPQVLLSARAFSEVGRWFGNGHLLLSGVAERHADASPVRCWSSHAANLGGKSLNCPLHLVIF